MGGTAWARRQRPHRIRATYRRTKGTEQFLGFYDVHADCLSGLFRRRKRVLEISEAFRRLRRCYPRRRLFLIPDNLHNVHDHPRVLAPSAKTLLISLCGQVSRVPSPTSGHVVRGSRSRASARANRSNQPILLIEPSDLAVKPYQPTCARMPGIPRAASRWRYSELLSASAATVRFVCCLELKARHSETLCSGSPGRNSETHRFEFNTLRHAV